MASKRGTSIIDWLSDVEASSHFSLPDSSLRDSSLSCNTHSPPTQQSLYLSSPCRGILQHPRKRKHHPKSLEFFADSSHVDRRTRKALCEIMDSNNRNKRRHTDTASEIGEQEVGLEIQTPQKGPSSSQSKSWTPTASQSTPHTPGSARKRREPTLAKNEENIRDTLALHGLWFDDEEAFVRCPKMKDMVEEIIGDTRATKMADSSVKKAMATAKEYYTKNEKTYFNKVRPLIIKATRLVTEQDSESSEYGEYIKILKKEFQKDGLEMVEDQNFTKHLLPLPESVANDKVMGLTNPNPDYTYGIVKPKRFPAAEVHVPAHIKVYLSVAPSMRFPFYVEEHKPASEGIIKAEHQAMRDGATLVNARRQLNHALESKGWASPAGPDMDSFVFTCAWTPYMAEIFVNWYEKLQDGQEIYHMTMVGDYKMKNADEMKKLRHDIENILDWGLLKHQQRAQQVWDGIVNHFTRLNASQA